jgi:hypothetical protein
MTGVTNFRWMNQQSVRFGVAILASWVLLSAAPLRADKGDDPSAGGSPRL